MVWWYGYDSSGLREGPWIVSYEHGNEISVSTGGIPWLVEGLVVS